MSFIEAVYELRARTPVEARRLALAVAREQTLEAVPGLAPAALEAALLGRVESLERKAAGRYTATLLYSEALIGGVGGVGSLVNLLFGNVSLFGGVRLADVRWPRSLLDRFPGPAFGLEGLRAETGVRGRALLCAILKPVGLTARALARQARALALAGIDVIKDDHNLADQASAPFADRVRWVQDAIAAANARTGRSCLYLPHLSGGGSVLVERVELLHESGIRGVLIAPLLLGWETTAALAAESGLLLLAHPTTSGVFFGRQHGVAREVLFGELLRIAGADGVIFPNAGGRFPVPIASCREVTTRLRAPRGDLRPSFPAPGGGMDVKRVARWRRVYGDDTLFLLGSALLKEPDLGGAVAALLQVVEA
ncbi:MAG: RuBisCO large subunit C-terminal-like domain-containing protein [Acidobacteriota bacterium]